MSVVEPAPVPVVPVLAEDVVLEPSVPVVVVYGVVADPSVGTHCPDTEAPEYSP